MAADRNYGVLSRKDFFAVTGILGAALLAGDYAFFVNEINHAKVLSDLRRIGFDPNAEFKTFGDISKAAYEFNKRIELIKYFIQRKGYMKGNIQLDINVINNHKIISSKDSVVINLDDSERLSELKYYQDYLSNYSKDPNNTFSSRFIFQYQIDGIKVATYYTMRSLVNNSGSLESYQDFMVSVSDKGVNYAFNPSREANPYLFPTPLVEIVTPGNTNLSGKINQNQLYGLPLGKYNLSGFKERYLMRDILPDDIREQMVAQWGWISAPYGG